VRAGSAGGLRPSGRHAACNSARAVEREASAHKVRVFVRVAFFCQFIGILATGTAVGVVDNAVAKWTIGVVVFLTSLVVAQNFQHWLRCKVGWH
jgi:hypothetical protein